MSVFACMCQSAGPPGSARPLDGPQEVTLLRAELAASDEELSQVQQHVAVLQAQQQRRYKQQQEVDLDVEGALSEVDFLRQVRTKPYLLVFT